MIKHFVLPIITSVAQLFLLIVCVVTLTKQLDFHDIFQPIDKPSEIRISLIKKDLLKLGVSKKELEKMSKSVQVASDLTNVDAKIISTVASVESNFKLNAVSSKGYKGLMQTRIASMEFVEVDILMGAKELQKWIRFRNGDLKFALASYNGGTYPPKESWTYAENVIRIIQKL